MSDTIVRKRRDIPFPVEVKADRPTLWCTCGLSLNQPWCDNSHRGTNFLPLPYRAPASFKVVLCGCKRTRNPPYCDGCHVHGADADSKENAKC
jgi:CDGSH-type Zn-finger protein